MGFYYFSVFSIFPLGIAYGLLLLAYWGLRRVTQGMPARKALLAIIGAVFLVLPISEELWIAWNFGQACKTAGTKVYKRVQVDGFYDDTTHWWRQLAESKYQFVESRDNLYGTLWRVERNGNETVHFKIQQPMARYWYEEDKGKKLGHKVDKQQSTITDKQLGELIAVYARISREAPWFFISLGRPNQGCDGPDGGPHSKGSFLIYRDVLLPSSSAIGVSK